MNVIYDSKADALYIRLMKNKKATSSVEVRDDLIVDYAGKTVIGIEILDISKKVPKGTITPTNITIPEISSYSHF